MNEQDEAIVRRFALQEEDFIAVDNTIKANEWGASKEQIYEFQTAFDIVGEGAKQLNEQQVNDLFLAIGYTMQDTELEILFQKCVRGEGGTFTYEVLLEGILGNNTESCHISLEINGRNLNSNNLDILIRTCFVLFLFYCLLTCSFAEVFDCTFISKLDE